MDYPPLGSAYDHGPWPIFACILTVWTASFGLLAFLLERRHTKTARYAALFALVLAILLAGFVTVGTFIAFASQPKGPTVFQLAAPFAAATLLFVGFAARLFRGERPTLTLVTAAAFAGQISLWFGAYLTWSTRRAAETTFAERCSSPPQWGWALEREYLLASAFSKQALVLVLAPVAVTLVIALVDWRRHRGEAVHMFVRAIQITCLLGIAACLAMFGTSTKPDPRSSECEPVIMAQDRIGRALVIANAAFQSHETEKGCQLLRTVQDDLRFVRDPAMRPRFDELWTNCRPSE